jgi:hemerythrin superfamily protein
MTDLITELKNEHIFIVETLHKAKDLLITTKDGQNTLRFAKKFFLEHLKKEDEKLYPVLKEAAKEDIELKQILDKFIKEMDIVSKVTIDFFDTYSNGGDGEKFAADFARFFIKLSRRIKNEEEIIYKKYDELMK